jgi:citronellol/citronellal dehydrogenase
MSLDDRVAIVTGAGHGIGKATAIALAKAGAHVAAVDIDPAAAKATADAVAALGRRSLALDIDVGEVSAIDRMASHVAAALGRIDVLVNNAGGQFAQRAESFSVKGWRAVVDTNLNGTWYVTQAVGRRMIAAHGGRIVSVIANHHRGIPGNAHTSAARAAVGNLTKTLAVEWARHGIRVNAVAPGPIGASGFTRDYETGVVRRAAGLPLGRLGTVEEVAAAIMFLASPASAWTTGTTLDVTGGQHLAGDMWVVDPEVD